MVQAYKVVKPFDITRVGDVLVYIGNDTYEMGMDSKVTGDGFSYKSSRYISLNSKSIERYVQNGFLEALFEEDEAEECNQDACDAECNITAEEKIEKIQETIDSLKTAYIDNNKQVDEAYANKEIPACVKVEANTVHYNLMKLIGKIQEIIDEK